LAIAGDAGDADDFALMHIELFNGQAWAPDLTGAAQAADAEF